MDLNILTRLFDGLDAYIIAVDSEFNIKFANGRVSLISGRHPDEMLNKKCYNVVHGYNKPCKNCPIAENKDFSGTKVIIKDIVTYKGDRIFARSAFTRISDDLYVASFIDITDIERERLELTHSSKESRANNFRLAHERNIRDNEITFLEKAIDNMAHGIMIVDDGYNIKTINKMLKETSKLGKKDFESIKCYNVYGFDEPCKDCPFKTDNSKALRQMHDKHMTIMFSKFDKYIVESLRNTTREIKLIDDIRESQEEIKEKQRQMSIMNTDLLRMNEKLKTVQALIEDELKQVGHIQESLLPENLPQVNGYDFGATYIPAEQAGGDYYDCIQMSNNYWGFVVADVSGHGTPAAVIMAITRAIMRSYTFDVLSASDALTMVNDILCDNIHTKDFVTMFYAVLNTNNGIFNLASAGHNPVLFFDSSEFIVKKITASGMFLGTFEGLNFEEKKWHIEEGDIFFMYTDGLVEAMNSQREQYGYDRLVSKLMMFSDYPAERLIKEVMEDVRDFTAGAPFEDDITILVIKRNKKEKENK